MSLPTRWKAGDTSGSGGSWESLLEAMAMEQVEEPDAMTVELKAEPQEPFEQSRRPKPKLAL